MRIMFHFVAGIGVQFITSNLVLWDRLTPAAESSVGIRHMGQEAMDCAAEFRKWHRKLSNVHLELYNDVTMDWYCVHTPKCPTRLTDRNMNHVMCCVVGFKHMNTERWEYHMMQIPRHASEYFEDEVRKCVYAYAPKLIQ